MKLNSPKPASSQRAYRLRSTARALAARSAVYGLADIVGKVAALVTVPYLTRQLSPAGYGLADLALSLAALAALVTRFGGEIPAGRMHAAAAGERERRRALGAYAVTTAVIGLAVSILLLPLGQAIAGVLWDAPSQVPLAIAAVLLVPVTVSQTVLLQVLRFELKASSFAIGALVDIGAKLLFVVGLVGAGFGPVGVVIGFLLGSVVGAGTAGWMARPYIDIHPDGPRMRRLFVEGLPFLPALAAFTFADTISRVIAANVLGIEDVGHLAVAIRLAGVVGLVTGPFSLAWGPTGLSLAPSKQTVSIFRRIVRIYSTVMLLGVGALGSLTPEILAVVAGDEYMPAAPLVPSLLLAGAMTGLLYILTTAAGVSGRGVIAAGSSTLGVAVQIAVTLWLLPVTGLIGIGIAAVAGRAVSVGWLVTTLIGTRDQTSLDLGFLLAAALVGTAGITALTVAPELSFGPRLGIAAVGLTSAGLVLRTVLVPPLSRAER